jgi:hypothetical protein
MVLFPIRDDDPEPARLAAQAAVDQWRTGAVSAAEIATTHGGIALEDRIGLTSADDAELQPFIRAFLHGGAGLRVSDPVREGAAFYVMKISGYEPATEFRYEDPAVQERLRAELINEEVHRMEERASARDRSKVFVWQPRR